MITSLKNKIIIAVLATIIDFVVVLPIAMEVFNDINVLYWGGGIIGVIVLILTNSIPVYLKAIRLAWNAGYVLLIFPLTLICSIAATLFVGVFGLLFPIIPILITFIADKMAEN